MDQFEFNVCGVCCKPEIVFQEKYKRDYFYISVASFLKEEVILWDYGVRVNLGTGGCGGLPNCGVLKPFVSRDEAIKYGLNFLVKYFVSCLNSSVKSEKEIASKFLKSIRLFAFEIGLTLEVSFQVSHKKPAQLSLFA